MTILVIKKCDFYIIEFTLLLSVLQLQKNTLNSRLLCCVQDKNQSMSDGLIENKSQFGCETSKPEMGYPPTLNPFIQPNHLDQKWQHLGEGQVPFSARTQWWAVTRRTADYGGVINGNHLLSCLFWVWFRPSHHNPILLFFPHHLNLLGWDDGQGGILIWGCHHRKEKGGQERAPTTTFKHLHWACEWAHVVHTSCMCTHNPKCPYYFSPFIGQLW